MTFGATAVVLINSVVHLRKPGVGIIWLVMPASESEEMENGFSAKRFSRNDPSANHRRHVVCNLSSVQPNWAFLPLLPARTDYFEEL
jgi:hypothetical protein